MKPKLEARIQEVEIEAEYRGTVYEQTAVLETNQDTIDVFDGSGVATQELIGESHVFVIMIEPREKGVEILDEPIHGISDATEKISKWSYNFSGQIVEPNVEDVWFRDKYDNLLLLDIGVGIVLLRPTDDMIDWMVNGELEEGDYIRVSAARTDLVAISS